MNKVISVLGIIALFVVTGCEQVETALEKDVAMSQEVNEESASRAAVLVSVTTYGASWCHFCNVHKRGMGLEDGVKKVFDYGFGKVPMVYIDTEKSDVKAPKIDQCGGIPLTVAEVLFPTRLKKRRVFFC
ncbi:MAG: hypothetical protein CL678_18775 [Bdellovibrionaceae bacterium]|nr:hypothetical protein [Pseudobdellovibrionaceae bacterium]